jgi:hypothetical protein
MIRMKRQIAGQSSAVASRICIVAHAIRWYR